MTPVQAGDALSPHITALRRLTRAAQDAGWLTGCNPGRLMDLIMALEDAGDAAVPVARAALDERITTRRRSVKPPSVRPERGRRSCVPPWRRLCSP